ncbi:hypothetical protein [Marilutibacter spongiae]|uniref:Uncharacterized protein n=1 Tax=Marilutibacter spongiae TaxID=2025720 RepID=A0A7W3TL97_9GAMM|nr:hypothetical protein [Lysobacter spongiae]MBB1060386.1 hypothetical protein [Lysobacter spongiae]
MARDRAWARFYASRGLRPVTKDLRQQPNPVRLAAYAVRRALSTCVKH